MIIITLVLLSNGLCWFIGSHISNRFSYIRVLWPNDGDNSEWNVELSAGGYATTAAPALWFDFNGGGGEERKKQSASEFAKSGGRTAEVVLRAIALW